MTTFAKSSLLYDEGHTAIQAFMPDPEKSQVKTAMTGNITFKKGVGGTIDITGWLFLRIDPTLDSTYYFNADTTKTYPLRAGVDNLIPVGHLADGASLTAVFGSATASVQGM